MYVHLTLPYFLKSIEKARLGGGGARLHHAKRFSLFATNKLFVLQDWVFLLSRHLD